MKCVVCKSDKYLLVLYEDDYEIWLKVMEVYGGEGMNNSVNIVCI